MCVCVCLLLQDFVSQKLGQRFIEPQTAELSLVFRDSSTITPLIFVLSVGTDPASDLYKFAEEVRTCLYMYIVDCWSNHSDFVLPISILFSESKKSFVESIPS